MTDRILVINPGAIAETVKIVHPDGREDSVQIAPKGRAHLTEGQDVHPVVAHLQPHIIVHRPSTTTD